MDVLKNLLRREDKVQIRPVCESDFDQLSKIYRDSLKDNPEGFIQDVSFHGEIATIVERMLAQNGAVLVAEVRGKVVGFGGLKPESDGSVEMCKLHVRKDYQGFGIGKKLALGLIDVSEQLGHELVTLHVTVTQKVAIQLYERLGFKKTDRKVYDVKDNQHVRSFDTLFMEFSNISSSKLSRIA